MPNQIRSALILPADWKVEAPRRTPGEVESPEFEDAEMEAQEDQQESDSTAS